MIKIALLGAESTGKTQLAADLAAALSSRGQQVLVVSEYLRAWCDQHGRTPRADEQAAIAQVQTAHIAQAPASATHLIADTTALMTAVYSELLFGDDSLYARALEQQRRFDLTLLMGLDLPWVADSQRDGAYSREPVNALLRTALARGSIPYQVVYGHGPARVQNALHAIDSIAGSKASHRPSKSLAAWSWNCEKCSDPECEHRLFSDLLNR